jgi:segregation and condensation protein B
MAGRSQKRMPQVVVTTDVVDSQPLGLDDFVEPDDQGLSLDELSQAYAALLSKGADPYPEPVEGESGPVSGGDSLGGDPANTAEVEPADEPLPIVRGADDEACEITPRSILEAILFVGHPTGEPLTSERIAALMRGVRPAEIDDLVQSLNEEYAAAQAPYAIVSVGAGYQLALRPEFGPLRDAFYGRVREARLSQAAIDILAIVAYHQPVTADDIDLRRGKPSGAIVSQLVRRDLLVIDRPAEKKAKPHYRTTARFLDLFDLNDLSELPRSQEIDRQL